MYPSLVGVGAVTEDPAFTVFDAGETVPPLAFHVIVYSVGGGATTFSTVTVSLADIVCKFGDTLVFVAVTTNLNEPVDVDEDDGKSAIFGVYIFVFDDPTDGLVIVPVASVPFPSSHPDPLLY